MTTVESATDYELLSADRTAAPEASSPHDSAQTEPETEDYLEVDVLYARLEDAEIEDERRCWRRRIAE